MAKINVIFNDTQYALEESNLSDIYTKMSASFDELTIVSSKGLDFNLNRDGVSYFVSRGTCTDNNIIVPSKYKGLPVTHVNSFQNCSSLTSIDLPTSITYINNFVFLHSTNLTTINYAGTKEQWNNIEKHPKWRVYDEYEDPVTGSQMHPQLVISIRCTNGTIQLSNKW